MKKAKESARVKRARKKLEKQFETESKQITPKALEKMREGIYTWLARHSEERVPLKSKEIKIFDENVHSAKTRSAFVKHLSKQLEGEIETSTSLKGRLKPKAS